MPAVGGGAAYGDDLTSTTWSMAGTCRQTPRRGPRSRETMRPPMIRRTLLTLATVAAALAALASPAAAAGPVTRTFNAYDLTQCVCTYNSLRTAAYIQSYPRPTVTSFYDSTINAQTNPYTRGSDVNLYHAYNGAGSLTGQAIWTVGGETVYVMCWATASSGAYMDKVAAKLTVNDVYAWFIFYLPDSFVHDYVLASGHHC